MDIGARTLVGAVPPARDAAPVRVLEPCTPALQALVVWLGTGHSDTGAMASPAVSLVPIVERLEPRGLSPSRVNARQVTTVPGRQTDGHEAPWRQQRQALGLLQASVRPDAEMGVRRTLLRHRATLSAPCAPHLLRLQNTLTLLNRPLRAGRTAITGVTGQAILRARVAGERDRVTLAHWRHPAWQASADQIAKALSGTWRDELWCPLPPTLALFDDSTHKSAEGDAPLERPCAAMQPRVESEEPPTP